MGSDERIHLVPNLFVFFVVAQAALEILYEGAPVGMDAGSLDVPSFLLAPDPLVPVLGFDATESPARAIAIDAASCPVVYLNPFA